MVLIGFIEGGRTGELLNLRFPPVGILGDTKATGVKVVVRGDMGSV